MSRALPDTARRVGSAVRRRTRTRALGALLRDLDGPVSSQYGFDRGTPVDRPYIEAFLARHADDVRGHVLEVKDDTYARRYGGADLDAVDVVDVDGGNSRATLVLDLDRDPLPRDRYDCVLLTQTLQFLDLGPALSNLYAALRPGGVLLVTTGVLCRLETRDSDKWRLPAAGLSAVLAQHLPTAQLEVEARGSAVAAAAFALGLSVEDLGGALPDDDWRFPVVATARVRRPR